VTSDIIDVTDVEVLRGRIVRLTFEAGEVRDIDLSLLLWGPAFKTLTDDGTFRQVRVDPEAGTIVWPGGADISAHTLYTESEPAGGQRSS
jgi:hypothetical protein